jgi:hypothetical protein
LPSFGNAGAGGAVGGGDGAFVAGGLVTGGFVTGGLVTGAFGGFVTGALGGFGGLVTGGFGALVAGGEGGFVTGGFGCPALTYVNARVSTMSPSSVCSTTSKVPGVTCARVCAVIQPRVSLTMFAYAPSISTPTPASTRGPVIEIVVPPLVGPAFGVTE